MLSSSITLTANTYNTKLNQRQGFLLSAKFPQKTGPTVAQVVLSNPNAFN